MYWFLLTFGFILIRMVRTLFHIITEFLVSNIWQRNKMFALHIHILFYIYCENIGCNTKQIWKYMCMLFYFEMDKVVWLGKRHLALRIEIVQIWAKKSGLMRSVENKQLYVLSNFCSSYNACAICKCIDMRPALF